MTIDDKIGLPIATAATASPWWLPMLEEWSRVAALVLPLLGVVWMILQIAGKIRSWREKNTPPKG